MGHLRDSASLSHASMLMMWRIFIFWRNPVTDAGSASPRRPSNRLTTYP